MKLVKKVFRKRQKLRDCVKGTLERPRLSIFRSNKYLYVQVIDDTNCKTLVSYSTNSLDFKKKYPTVNKNSCFSAQILGKTIAIACIEKNIDKIIFDRGRYLYHGRVKTIAENARIHGLKF